MILLASQWVNQIPMATLVGVMVMIAINTVNWASISDIRRIPKSDSAVMLLTVGAPPARKVVTPDDSLADCLR